MCSLCARADSNGQSLFAITQPVHKLHTKILTLMQYTSIISRVSCAWYSLSNVESLRCECSAVYYALPKCYGYSNLRTEHAYVRLQGASALPPQLN